MRIEGEHQRLQAAVARQAERLRDDGSVPAMHAVEITDRDERRLLQALR
jgi:hypothetical protein